MRKITGVLLFVSCIFAFTNIADAACRVAFENNITCKHNVSDLVGADCMIRYNNSDKFIDKDGDMVVLKYWGKSQGGEILEDCPADINTLVRDVYECSHMDYDDSYPEKRRKKLGCFLPAYQCRIKKLLNKYHDDKNTYDVIISALIGNATYLERNTYLAKMEKTECKTID